MTRPIRVLLLAEGLVLAGGVERFVCALADHLATQGMNVAVGTVDTPRAGALSARSVRLLAGATSPALPPAGARMAPAARSGARAGPCTGAPRAHGTQRRGRAQRTHHGLLDGTRAEPSAATTTTSTRVRGRGGCCAAGSIRMSPPS
jgi:hypothetical protein